MTDSTNDIIPTVPDIVKKPLFKLRHLIFTDDITKLMALGEVIEVPPVYTLAPRYEQPTGGGILITDLAGTPVLVETLSDFLNYYGEEISLVVLVESYDPENEYAVLGRLVGDDVAYNTRWVTSKLAGYPDAIVTLPYGVKNVMGLVDQQVILIKSRFGDSFIDDATWTQVQVALGHQVPSEDEES